MTAPLDPVEMLRDLIASLKKDGKLDDGGEDDLDDLFFGGRGITDHVTKLIRSRTLKLEGDTSHATVRSAFRTWANVDKPRKYDFQPENVGEEDAIREIVPSYPNPLDGNTKKAIAGEDTVKFRLEHRCFECMKPLFGFLKGDTLILKGDEACEDHSNYKVVLDFPTGEVVIDDAVSGVRSLEDIHDDLFGNIGSINYQIGTHQVTDAWAALNVGHFFVGNSCPSVALDSQGRLLMRPDESIPYADPEHDETYEDDEPNPDAENLQGCVRLGAICTDLWWATFVDLSNWEHLVASQGWKVQDMDATIDEFRQSKKIINVRPGKWEFHYQTVEPTNGGDWRRRVTATFLG